MSSDVTVDARQTRIREFMQLLPLTMEIAGLPKNQPGAIFTQDQLDLRATVLRNSYKLARNLVKEIGEGT